MHTVVEGVRAKLAEIAPSLPLGVTTKIFYDRGALVDRAIGTVARALVEAIVLVVVLLLAFLGNLRAALAVACVLPLAALVDLILMSVFGMSAKYDELGRLGDCHRHAGGRRRGGGGNVESQLADPAGAKLPFLHRICAVREVTEPVVSGMAIIVIVFLPLLTLQGLEGKLFIPVALTIIFALWAPCCCR